MVNVYTPKGVLASAAPRPTKTLLNLTTSITGVAFNHDAYVKAYVHFACSAQSLACRQILSFWSSGKNDALRLVCFICPHCTACY